jgi:DNA polymerase-3 subunit epsilon
MVEPTPWHRRKLGAFDLETTGIETASDRIVTASYIELDAQTGTVIEHEWLINPGIEIPTGATEVHGVTTEHAREHGRDPREAIAEINAKLNAAYAEGIPVIGFNISYDLSLLHNESIRNGLTPASLGGLWT